MKERSAKLQKKDPVLLLSTRRPLTVIVPIAVFLLLLLTIILVTRNHSIDHDVFNVIRPLVSDGTTSVMHFFSFLGNHIFLAPLSLLLIIYFLIRKKKWMAIETATVMISSVLLMSLLKRLVQRQRPDFPMVEGITNFSFPSGHSFMSMVFYGLMIWYAAAYIENRWVRLTTILILSFIIAAIGFSRIYLRVHYASDVVAGFCFAYIWLLACIWFVDKREASFTVINKN